MRCGGTFRVIAVGWNCGRCGRMSRDVLCREKLESCDVLVWGCEDEQRCVGVSGGAKVVCCDVKVREYVDVLGAKAVGCDVDLWELELNKSSVMWWSLGGVKVVDWSGDVGWGSGHRQWDGGLSVSKFMTIVKLRNITRKQQTDYLYLLTKHSWHSKQMNDAERDLVNGLMSAQSTKHSLDSHTFILTHKERLHEKQWLN